MRFRLSLVLAAALLAAPSAAHELKTVALGLDEGAEGQWRVTLKLPLARDGGPASVIPVFSENCRSHGAQRAVRQDDVVIREWRMVCERPLAEEPVLIRGLDPATPDAVVLVNFANGKTHTVAVDRHDPYAVIAAAENEGAANVAAYLTIGIEHILLGPDHLLFVLGLLLIVVHRPFHGSGEAVRPLVITITAFTLAHSLTLALAVLGIWGLPGGAVEVLIALSILLLAVELARRDARAAAGLPPSLTLRKPWLVAFVFGLLHGFGFAGALAEVGLPEQARGWALLLFNLGVEVGQLLFVAAVLLIFAAARRLHLQPGRVAIGRWSTTLLGAVAAFWTIERAVLWSTTLQPGA